MQISININVPEDFFIKAHPRSIGVLFYLCAQTSKKIGREATRKALNISEHTWRIASRELREMGLLRLIRDPFVNGSWLELTQQAFAHP